MNHTRTFFGIACIGAFGMLGCAKPDIHEMMKLPPRPAELDRLDKMAGNWDFTMTFKMGDQSMNGHGTSHVEWDCDRWMLTERVEGQMEGQTGTYHGKGAYIYDPSAKKYHMMWYGNNGGLMHGMMTYDDDKKVWHCEGKGRDTIHGMSCCTKATIKWVDDNTVEFKESMYDGLGLFKMGESTMTMKRKM